VDGINKEALNLLRMLKNALSLLRTLVEEASDSIIVVGGDGQITFVNQETEVLFGYSREALLGQSVEMLMPEPLREVHRGHLARFASAPARRPMGTELHVFGRRRDGSTLPVEVSVSPIQEKPPPAQADEAQQGGAHFGIGAVIYSIRDITERVALEQRLRESEQLFRTTFEHATVGIAHVGLEGRWLRFNQRLCDIVGYTRDELAERTFQEITHPDDRENDIAQLRRMLAGAEEAYEVDKRYIRKDGTTVWVHLSARIERTPNGAPKYFLSVIQDINERKQLERERARLLRQERAARLEAEASLARANASEAQAAERAEEAERTLETMSDGVALYDRDGRLMRTNRAYRELLATDRAPAGFDDATAKERAPLFEVRGPSGAPLTPDRLPIMRALAGEVVTGPDAECRVRAFDGRELDATTNASPIHDAEGKVVGAVVVVRDVTWRRRLESEREAARTAEQAAQEVAQRVEEFLATAGHELRTPVTSALGFLELAIGECGRLATALRGVNPDFARRVRRLQARLDDTNQGLDRLARLTKILFDTSEMHTGQIELHRTRSDLAALVREQMEAQRVASPQRAIVLQLPAGEHIPLAIDADRIGQVIANFLSNALKYSPSDQPIEISVETDGASGRPRFAGGWVRVAVRDHGPGLPKDERERVWEPFHKVRGIKPQPGTSGSIGLGLHICRKIIRAHGGQVGVNSELGHGSTFWFALPLATRAGARRPRADPPGATSDSTQGHSVELGAAPV
jgi:PAS domain S-box-containing protein